MVFRQHCALANDKPGGSPVVAAMTDEQINQAKKIIITLLVAVVGLMVLHRIGSASKDMGWLNGMLEQLGAVMTTSVPVPFWVLAVLLAGCATFCFGLLSRLRTDVADGDEPVADDYKEDVILGVTWHWDYNPSSGEIEDLRCVCPRCFEPATYRENSFTPLGPVTVAQCRTCGDIRDLKGTKKQALATVRNQIQDKLRRGMFREVVKRQRAKAGVGKVSPEPPEEPAPAPKASSGKNPFGGRGAGEADGNMWD